MIHLHFITPVRISRDASAAMFSILARPRPVATVPATAKALSGFQLPASFAPWREILPLAKAQSRKDKVISNCNPLQALKLPRRDAGHSVCTLHLEETAVVHERPGNQHDPFE